MLFPSVHPSGESAPVAARSGGSLTGRAAAIAGALLFAGVLSAAAQPAWVGVDVKHDVSPPLRKIPPIPPKPWTTVREMPEPVPEGAGGQALPPVADAVAQLEFSPGRAAV